MHLDVVRHFFPAKRILRFLDLLAMHKFNRFHWHLTDDQGWRIPIPGRPRLAEVASRRVEPDGSVHEGIYTADEIREVVAYAAERHITVVPEIEMPGHAMAALAAYPELVMHGRTLRPFPPHGASSRTSSAPGKEATFRFLGEVLDEVAELFPGPLHPHRRRRVPDARWNACPDCGRRVAEEGLTRHEELQGYLIRRVAAHPSMRGRRLIGWDEILGGAPPPQTIVMSLARARRAAVPRPRRDTTSSCVPWIRATSIRIRAPTTGSPRRFLATLRSRPSTISIRVPAGLSPEGESRILGTQGNVWTEHISSWNHLEYMTFPRACALAEVAWSLPMRRDWNAFRDRLSGHLPRLDARGIRYRIP